MNDNDKPISKPPLPHDIDPSDHHDHPAEHEGTDASRRKFLKTSATGLAAGTIIGTGLAGDVIAGMAHGRHHGFGRHPGFGKGHGRKHGPPPGHGKGRHHRILLKGGVVLTMDPDIGDFEQANVLIEDSRILAVQPNIRAAAEVIDCRGMILIPGFVDPHRHAWLGQLRGIIPDAVTYPDYNNATHLGFGPHYRPHDIYVGNLFTAIGCIDAGITCIIDNSHNSRSMEHSDAAIEALFDSGMRAVHASGAPQGGEWDMQWPADLARIKEQYFSSDDQLITLRMFSPLIEERWEVARELDLWITTEGGGGSQLEEFYNLGLFDGRNTFNHVTNTSDRNWQLIRDLGATVNVTPRSDPQYGLGPGIPAIQDALDHGMRPGISVDGETSYGTDMFTEMRVCFYFQRGLRQNAIFNEEPDPPEPLTVRDILEFATLRGAECAALAHKIGTLTPGKEADIVGIRADDINTFPLANAVGTVVSFANTRNVDTVIIGGKIQKYRGELVSVDMRKIKRLVQESREYLLGQFDGYQLDVLGQ